jgi:hypothetical protein
MREQARSHVVAVRKAAPQYNLQEFFTAFPFEADVQALFRKGAGLAGLS